MENFDQRLIHDSAAFDFAEDDDDFDPEECGPILCDEDDDGPDFTKMRQKEQSQQQAGIKKEQDIRRRFQLDKPAPNSAQNLSGQTSAKSQATVSTDYSNPLASMAGD